MLALDPVTHDMEEIKTQSDLSPDSIAQSIKTRLLFFRGEDFLDSRAGMPYYQEILRKNPNRAVVLALFRRRILSVLGVVSVRRLDFSLDPVTREALVSWSVVIADGSEIQGRL